MKPPGCVSRRDRVYALFVQQGVHCAPSRTGQRVERADVIKSADERDGALPVAVGLIDGAAQTLELV